MEGWQSRMQAKVLTAGAVRRWSVDNTLKYCTSFQPYFEHAGVVGSLTGAVLSILQQKHFLRHSLGTAASCMICVGGFAGSSQPVLLCCVDLCRQGQQKSVILPLNMKFFTAVCQETSRLLRCEDTAANSIVAGAATGALLLGLQRESVQLLCCVLSIPKLWAAPSMMPQFDLEPSFAGGKNASLPAAIVCGGAAGIGHLLCDSLQPVQMFQQWLVDNDLMDRPGFAFAPQIHC